MGNQVNQFLALLYRHYLIRVRRPFLLLVTLFTCLVFALCFP